MRKALQSKYSNRDSMLRTFSFVLITTLLAAFTVGCPIEEESPKPSGVVMVTVKAYSGAESAISDNPTPDMVNPQLPWITKYHLRFTSGDKDVDRDLKPSDVDTNEGYKETLEEGDWQLEVTGYTTSGAAAERKLELFTLSAAEHNVETPQKVAVVLAPADEGKGVFTYTINWPIEKSEEVSAVLRFEQNGEEKLTIRDIQKGVTAYSELFTGLYDLFISLSKGGEELTRYVLVSIAVGCETTLEYTFYQLPAPSDRYLAGTLEGIAGHGLFDPGTPEIKIYKDKLCTEPSLGTADWDGDKWSIKISGEHTKVYFTLSGSVGGKAYTVFAGELSSIPSEGKDDVSLNFAPIWYVKEGGSGNGGYTTPFGKVQDAVDHISGISSRAVSGETIHIKISGTVNDPTTISGSSASMIGGASSIILEGYDGSAGTINVGKSTGLLINVPSSLEVTLGQNLTLKGAMDSGVHVENGKFILDGGTISGNSAVNGGGVRIANSATFTMKNGSIEGNTVNGGEHGGGVYIGNGATFTMENGSIKENIVSDGGYGGGVYIADATFIMNSGSIEGNTVNDGGHGGGVYIGSAIFTMNNGSSIKGNTVNGGGNGGGVYLTSGGIFNSSGSISNNTPSNLGMGN
jgi:hypothetical protein